MEFRKDQLVIVEPPEKEYIEEYQTFLSDYPLGVSRIFDEITVITRDGEKNISVGNPGRRIYWIPISHLRLVKN